MGWPFEEFEVRFQAQARDISLLHSIQSATEAHPVSCAMGTGDSFPGGKAAGAWN
jgi:hypothetical protein